MNEGDKIISVFSGAGGLDLGFSREGYEIVYASDYNPDVKETYDKNHEGASLTVEDIRDISPEDLPDADGIIGGPPCQSWSLAGNLKGADDERGEVFWNYAELIKQKQPKFFLAENVPGIISKRNIDETQELIEEFEKVGYDVEYKKMNAAYYGVPQSRKRVFIVGIREDVDFDYKFPEATDTQRGQEIIKDMPISKPTKKEPHDSDELNMLNHEHYMGSYSSRYMSRNRVRNWDEPAYTVQANARHQKIHPKAPKMVKVKKDEWKFKEGEKHKYRRYSVREAARLQTFPDDFEFFYDENIRTGYKMVGNAVPVRLAQAIAKSLQGEEVDFSSNK